MMFRLLVVCMVWLFVGGSAWASLTPTVVGHLDPRGGHNNLAGWSWFGK